MRGAFDDEAEYERGRFDRNPVRPGHEVNRSSRDTELTLGVGSVLLMLLGLTVLCGVCFGAGYMVGHRRAQQQMVANDSSATDGDLTAPLTTGSQTKPSASSQPNSAPSVSNSAQPDATSQTATGDLPESAATAVSAAQGQGVTQAAASQGRPAMQPVAASQVAPTANNRVSASGLMVQIASISREEDAEVLVGALRKRGYAVSIRREPTDNMIHVRIGPFATRDEANRWRQKLLSDGYNAIIQ